MPEPIENHCRVGVLLPMAYPELAGGEGPLLERLSKVLEDEFFGAVELCQVNDDRVRREARTGLRGAGVALILASQPTLPAQKVRLNAADPAERRLAIETCQDLIDQAYELGARIMMVMSGPDPGEPDRDAARERLVDSLKQLCQYAGEQANEYLLA